MKSLLTFSFLLYVILTSMMRCGQGLVIDTDPVLELVEESKPSIQSNANDNSDSFTTSSTGTNSFGSIGGTSSGSTGTNSSGATGSPTTGATGSPPGNPFR